jgi:hypothetical protein
MKISIKIISVFILFIITTTNRANTILVPSDQPSIQKGIDAAANGDTVVVYPGTYYENIILKGKKIVVTSRFYESGDLNFVQSTIIDGSKPYNSDSASCVRIINREDSTTILQGFTITGGKGTKWRDEHGAGIYREGGGILIALSAPVIRYNLIINNEATNTKGVTSAGGGGIRAGDGNPKILNNVITTNQGRYGAGVVLNYTGAVVKNNIITNNSGGQDYGGGALWMNANGSKAKIIENNTIAGNKTAAVYVWQGGSEIRNCILWADSIVSTAQVGAHSGSGPAVTYSNVQGGRTGTGNINSNPQFADSSFHLSTTSPCIDSGDSSAVYNDVENPAASGKARKPSLGDFRNDIGAYGGPGAAELPFFSLQTELNPHLTDYPADFRLEQNYPNPFNPVTNISFCIPYRSNVSLKIYDLKGEEIIKIISEELSAGNYSVHWNAEGFPSGIYFYCLKAGNYTQTKKLVLLK